MRIRDIKDDWKKEMDAINEKLLAKAIENGLKREEYNFFLSKIKDLDDDHKQEEIEKWEELLQKY